jgi:hypothetical protein
MSERPRRRSSAAPRGEVLEAEAAAGRGTPNLQRKLSFAETTLETVYTSIGTTSKDVLADLSTGYLEAILLGQMASSFRELQNRTLSFWVKCYNKWLAMKEPPTLNFEQLQHVFGIGHHGAMSLAKLFDKQGSHRLSIEGQSSKTLGGIKVPVCSVMLAGVWLSPVIATQNKIIFAFGLFDKDDSGVLSEQEFRNFAQAIFTGMALVFGAEPPPPSALHRLTEIYYRQMSAHAGRRIRNALRRTVSLRDAVKQQIGERLASESQTQQVPYSVLQDFVFGKASEEDPLTLPFRLLLERFNPNRSVTFIDEFTDGKDTFKLSHSAPVPVPQEGSSVSVRDLLTRPEVVFSREMYQEFFELKAVIAEAELVERMDESRFVKSVRQEVQSRLVELNRDLCGQSIKLRGADGLFKMWKKLCPRAQPQHLKMFEKWCQEYDSLTNKKSSLKMAQSAETTFHENDLKPLLPAADLRRIKDEFSRLDTYGKGLIEVTTLASGLQLGDAYEVAKIYDGNDDGYIDANEFVRMMCPPEYRLPEMDGIGRRLFGELIEHEATALENRYNQQAASFEKSAESSHRLSGATPHTLLPEVDKGTWATWNATFDRLDMTSDAKVSLAEVIGSGFLSPEVATFVYQVLIPEDGNGDGFSREDFMSAMLRAHGVRRPHSLTQEACLGEDH